MCFGNSLQMKAYFDTYQIFFKENLPKLYTHFDTQRLTPDLYIIDWYAVAIPFTTQLHC